MKSPNDFDARDVELMLNVLFTSILLARATPGAVKQSGDSSVSEIATFHAKRIADEYEDVIEDEK